MNAATPTRPVRRPLRHAIPVVVLTLLATATPALATAEPARVVVDFAPGISGTARADALAAADVTVIGHDDVGDPAVTSLALAGDAGASAVAEATPAQRATLVADPRVATVYDDVPVHVDSATSDNPAGATAVVPDDPSWPDQDGVRRIRVDEVWEQTTGDDDVVIAVVDTGVDPDNADLQGRLVDGYDFVNLDADPSDDNGHGTAAATIAGAAGDAVGIAGVCWNCRVMPVKVLDQTGNGFLSDAAKGIAWAVDNGADIVNVSLGAPETMPLLDDALQAAVDAGVLVVASAGNAGTTAPQWPAADDRALAVAALDELDGRADYSNYGDWVEVAAPGCNPAGWLEDATVSFCGTSSSAPLVSGAAALLTSVRGATPASAVRAALRDTAVAAGAGLGSGRIDALAALRSLPSFDDIGGNVHADAIETLAAAGITNGCAPDLFCPDKAVTRGQMATFLARALDLAGTGATYADVATDHPHAPGISAVAAAGITDGCAPDLFCPDTPVTRAQMASFLDRALDLPDGPPRFADVDPDGVHTQGIWAIAAANITNGCSPQRYCPRDPVTRGQMASFLVRALDL